jgi:hypothetical protein
MPFYRPTLKTPIISLFVDFEKIPVLKEKIGEGKNIYLFERLTTIYSIEKFVIAINNIGILLPIKSVDISLSINSRENA